MMKEKGDETFCCGRRGTVDQSAKCVGKLFEADEVEKENPCWTDSMSSGAEFA